MLYFIGDPRYIERVCPAMYALMTGTHGKCGLNQWKAERNARASLNKGRIWHPDNRALAEQSDADCEFVSSEPLRG